MDLIIVNIGIVACLLLIYVCAVFLWARATKDNSVMDLAYGFSFLLGIGGTVLLTNTYTLLPLVITGAIAFWCPYSTKLEPIFKTNTDTLRLGSLESHSEHTRESERTTPVFAASYGSRLLIGYYVSFVSH